MSAHVRNLAASRTAIPWRVKLIRQRVAVYTGVSVNDLTSRRLARDISGARHIAMYLIRDLTRFSTPNIAVFLNRADHTSILYGIKKVKARIEGDPDYARLITSIREDIEGRTADPCNVTKLHEEAIDAMRVSVLARADRLFMRLRAAIDKDPADFFNRLDKL